MVRLELIRFLSMAFLDFSSRFLNWSSEKVWRRVVASFVLTPLVFVAFAFLGETSRNGLRSLADALGDIDGNVT